MNYWAVAILDLSDGELIDLYRRQGTRACLDELVRRHLPRIRAVILPILGQGAVADDLTQETFFRAMRGLHTFQGNAQFSTWLTRVAINTVREYQRSSVQRERITQAAVGAMKTYDYSPQHSLEIQETVDEIQSALLDLPEALREAVVLVCIQGQSATEAAQICGCTVTTLYWRIHQARKRLKKKLAKYL